jgi:5-methylcytosine-specific restriction endonuclease McrA
MSDLLNKTTVLVLNRNWQAIHIKTPAQAFCMMATDVATALDIEGKDLMRPVKWAEWLTLPIREGDNVVRTVHGSVRVPTVLVLASFAKVPVKRPKLSARTIWQRDGGVCQYTGQTLAPDEGNIDHVRPRSRGGKTTWENCVLAHKEVNSRKADKLPEEAGLTLRRRPVPPRELPVTLSIRNHHGVQDWERFLRRT